jgi:uncharacterized protein (DUF305 family)
LSGRVVPFAAGVLATVAAFGLAARAGTSADSFQAQMAEAMTRMHHGMMVEPTGDPDRDFAAMMIPHHQGAVDMAEAELVHGKDERLRRLSQAIIVEQTQEIAVMRQVLAERSAPPSASARHPGEDRQ